MITAASVKGKIQGLIDKANETTGNADTDLTTAVNALVEGYGQGGDGDSESLFIKSINDNIEVLDDPNITEIAAEYAFYKRKNLKKVFLPNCVKFANDAFSYSSIVELRLDGYVGITDINRANMFSYCGSLETVYLPLCQTLSVYMFKACTSLKNIHMPEVRMIRAGAFKESAIEEFIGRNVLEMQHQVFDACKQLKKIDINGANSNMESNLCANASLLETFILRATTLRTLNSVNAFVGTKIESGEGYIYVPSELVEEYKAATNWVVYADQICAIEDYPEITGG